MGGCLGPLQRLCCELVGVSLQSHTKQLFSETTEEKALTFVRLDTFLLTEFLRSVLVQSFGLSMTVHQIDHLLKTSFPIYAT